MNVSWYVESYWTGLDRTRHVVLEATACVVYSVQIKIPNGRCFRVNWFDWCLCFVLFCICMHSCKDFECLHLAFECAIWTRVICFAFVCICLKPLREFFLLLFVWLLMFFVVVVVHIIVIRRLLTLVYPAFGYLPISLASWVATCLSHLFISAKQKIYKHNASGKKNEEKQKSTHTNSK